MTEHQVLQLLVDTKAHYDQFVQAARQAEIQRDTMARQARELAGKIQALNEIYDTHYRVPVEEGTMLHGIDISKLDWQTRLMVQNGNIDTIQALGGSLE
jgi:hypothetical protein